MDVYASGVWATRLFILVLHIGSVIRVLTFVASSLYPASVCHGTRVHTYIRVKSTAGRINNPRREPVADLNATVVVYSVCSMIAYPGAFAMIVSFTRDHSLSVT